MKVFIYDKKTSKRLEVIKNVTMVKEKGYTITFYTPMRGIEYDTRKVKTSTFQN